MRFKEHKSRLAIDKIKKQLDDTNKNNESLSEKIKYYEDMRIKNMNNKGNNKENNLNKKKGSNNNI